MVEYKRQVEGLQGCFANVTDTKNLPTYVGIGAGMVVANGAANMVEKMYLDATGAVKTPGDIVQFLIRTVTRFGTAGLLCALGGSLPDEGLVSKQTTEAAAIGAAGVSVIDLYKEFAPVSWGGGPGGIADLQPPVRAMRPTDSRIQTRQMPRPQPRPQPRPMMESTALNARPMMESTALTSLSGAAI